MHVDVPTLVLIPVIAAIAPLATRAFGKWLAIPVVIFEIVLGIALGPSLLGWVQPDPFIELISDFGLAMLFFLAGQEIDFEAIRGRPLVRASLGWAISVPLGLAAGWLVDPDAGAVFIGIALTSTALGALLPILRDAGMLRTPFGVSVLAIGAAGEFLPLIAISIFLSGRSPLHAAIVLLAFAVITGLAIWRASRGDGRRLHGAIGATLHTSGQFAIRLVIMVMLALVGLSIVLDLDMLLGAFAAGVIARLLLAGAPEQDRRTIEVKLDGIGFGVFVPVFFIYTGVTFDLEALVEDARTLLMLPLFTVLLLVVRGVPSALLAAPGSHVRDRVSTGLFGATGLPIIVAVTTIGVEAGDMDSGTASALVGAGLLSLLLFPLIAIAITRSGSRRPRQESNLRPRD
ncbi:cation:proton antiporter [Agromyces binzhouensis]|uniref:Cation:proton antiporter n=1 Tax=Agromyces binzhouensis TaxID=1817495 RepID=A0A4Q2JK39_9MICO|nr:cation:proton antiporter [Agromyces binzhouensis]